MKSTPAVVTLHEKSVLLLVHGPVSETLPTLLGNFADIYHLEL